MRAIRRGWIKPRADRDAEAKPPPVYMLWDDDGAADYSRTGAGLAYIPAPKPELPGHDESYNPPAEFLPSKAERAAIEAAAEADEKVPFVPRGHECLRKVPQYERLVQERFERCLDLYLCPRVRSKRVQYKPEDLVPKALPQPGDLRPFPNTPFLTYAGHRSKVRQRMCCVMRLLVRAPAVFAVLQTRKCISVLAYLQCLSVHFRATLAIVMSSGVRATCWCVLARDCACVCAGAQRQLRPHGPVAADGQRRRHRALVGGGNGALPQRVGSRRKGARGRVVPKRKPAHCVVRAREQGGAAAVGPGRQRGGRGGGGGAGGAAGGRGRGQGAHAVGGAGGGWPGAGTQAPAAQHRVALGVRCLCQIFAQLTGWFTLAKSNLRVCLTGV